MENVWNNKNTFLIFTPSITPHGNKTYHRMTHVTFSQVSKSRPNYYNVYINGKAVSEIRYPSTNYYLKHMTLSELAKHEADRISQS